MGGKFVPLYMPGMDWNMHRQLTVQNSQSSYPENACGMELANWLKCWWCFRLNLYQTNMRITVPEKLIKIAREIVESGSASLTRLTVLKKWIEQDPKRLSSFVVFIARQALAGECKTSQESVELFREAGELLKETAMYDPKLDRNAAEKLSRRLNEFQCEYKKQQWGPVRIIHNWNLFLVEDALRIYLKSNGAVSDGYRLASEYCQNYDPKYGRNLNGPSLAKINEIARFLGFVEAAEHVDGI
jgi:hypothetical protein